MKHYSPNPQVDAVIHELLALGFAPIPVAPQSKSNKTKEGGYLGGFSGKNPSYLKRNNSHTYVAHKRYQDTLPSGSEIKEWFAHPDTGVGTMCGYDDTVWLDFDSKNFESQEECDRQVNDFITRNNLANHWIEQTGSGGWRVPIKVLEKPEFTNFALEPGGVRIGEALGRGRFTVLAPTIHPNGKPYRKINSGVIPEAASLQAIGIYPAADVADAKPKVDWVALKAQRNETRTNKVAQDLVGFLEFDVLPRLTAEQIFNWSGHKFRQYGKTLKGTPPWRASASGTSFHVWWDGNHYAWQDKAEGCGGGAVEYRWKLRGGTGTPKGKDYVDIVRDLAADAGVPMPEFLPQHSILEREELRKEHQERCDINEEFLHSFQSAIAKIKSVIFGQPKNSKYSVPASREVTPRGKVVASVDYVPGELPSYDQHLEILNTGIHPIYECSPSLHSVLWQEAVGKGWKHILDSSPTGSGKSHQAGLANPSDYEETKQLWYFASDHRNPTTKTIETGYIDLVVRNDGMKIDDTRKTPSGKNFVVWAKDGETKDIAGNCYRAPMYRALADKNIRGIELSSGNPICEGCVHFKSYVETKEGKQVPRCLAQSGDGFGFRGQRRDILASPKISAHPSTAPQPKEESVEDDKQQALFEEPLGGGTDKERGYDYSKSGAFWDEVSTLISISKSIDVRQSDLTKAYWEMQMKLPEFNVVLQPLWDVLASLIDPASPNYIQKRSRYGISDVQIRKLLPELPEEIDYIIERSRVALEPDLGFLNDDEGTKSNVYYKKKAQNYLAEFAKEEKTKKLSDVLLNWLVPFLEAWKDGSGYFQCNYGAVLNISTRDLRHVEVAKALKFNIYLDATHQPDLLALELDIDRTEILNIRTPLADHTNLQIHQIVGLGKMGKDRSDNLKERTAAVKTELQKRHSDKLGILEWKAQSQEGEGYHFRDGRGINRYKECEALAVFGAPYSNIGALAARYQLLTGKIVNLDSEERDPDFQRLIDHYVNSEIIQELGRLRAHLRSGEKLDFYFVADYDISWLNTYCPGASINKIDAFELTHNAGNKVQKVRMAIMEAAVKLRDRLGKNPTQEQVAAESGIKRGNIGRIAAQFGGWKSILKLFTFLYKSLYSKMNILGNPPDDAAPMENDDLVFLAKQYLPLLMEEHKEEPVKLCEELLTVQDAHGSPGIAAIFKETTFEVKSQILTILTQLLPDWMQEQFLQIEQAIA